jgi:hypothetical protein
MGYESRRRGTADRRRDKGGLSRNVLRIAAAPVACLGAAGELLTWPQKPYPTRAFSMQPRKDPKVTVEDCSKVSTMNLVSSATAMKMTVR